MTVVLSIAGTLAITGITAATTSAWVKTTAICPPGSEIDPQNS
jgi:hypothetical protein